MSVADTPLLSSLLGLRGAAIMRRFWTYGPATVREIHTWLTLDAPLAYTTTLTICTRLWERGLLDRQPAGKAYRYAPKVSEAEFLRTAITAAPEAPEMPVAAIPHRPIDGSDRATIEPLLVKLGRLRDESGRWRTIRWREGSRGWLAAEFHAVRAWRQTAHGEWRRGWLIDERPLRGTRGDQRYYWSNFPPTTATALRPAR